MNSPNQALDPAAGSVSVLLFTGFMTFLSHLDRAYPAVGQLSRQAEQRRKHMLKDHFNTAKAAGKTYLE